MSAAMTTARQAAEHLAWAIQYHNLVDLMYVEIRENTRMQQMIEQACETILDERAPDELACGCGLDLVELLESFQREGMLFERQPQERVPRMLRKIHIHAALRAAVVQLDQVREVLA